MTLLGALDIASVAVFALTGALVASRSQLDLIGFIFIACLTAVGGGTIRDVLLNRDAVFWVADPSILLAAVGAAVMVFLGAHLLESRYRALVWLDAFALAIAVPAGAGVAMGMGQHWAVVMVMGMATGCFGGLLRDVVCNEVPLVLKQGEIYATAAFAGAGVAVVLVFLEQASGHALIACAAVTFILRAGSITFGWRLPVYKTKPPRAENPKQN